MAVLAGAPCPGTISVTVTAVLFAVGGQALLRHLTAILVSRSRV